MERFGARCTPSVVARLREFKGTIALPVERNVILQHTPSLGRMSAAVMERSGRRLVGSHGNLLQ
jgi:hypothetical protein